jgi:hypothetical protein
MERKAYGRSGMDNGLQAINFDCLIKCAFDCNVFYYSEVELGSWYVGMSIFDLLGFLLGADGCYD